MPMSNHAARKDHVILRTVLIALSIIVLLVCVLMWWVTAFDSVQQMAAASRPSVHHASTPEGHLCGPAERSSLARAGIKKRAAPRGRRALKISDQAFLSAW
ncbi:hypothetical protein ACXU4B_16530 [Dyella soli]|uniref:Uncharacterized protein n=1 Tax=Dyella soli TaxID=522319 RepID=A0A4R0YLT7_9GAMM|nr:hypothetical protein [Dyella soli]TCI06583.1 hypothetical protein EZM97_34485 [Dyella soli]